MDNEEALPRKALFQKKITVRKLAQAFCESSAFDKTDISNSKARIQFEHDLEVSLRAIEKEVHQQRLENLRHLAGTLKEDSWRYPDLENSLRMY